MVNESKCQAKRVKIFHNRITQLRDEKSISRCALTKKIGTSPNVVNFWESGKAEPSTKFTCALADTFEVTCDYLLGREDDFGNVNVMRNLTEIEKLWLELYKKLSPKQFAEAVNYANHLISNT
ncbi:MAG: helix-turn-helix transcriptional regulator [Clostridia bacterium]|nr:helix-turn-helix transcriptional regulator [Clostridia bacterium]